MSKFVALHPEQLIFETEADAVAYYRQAADNPKVGADFADGRPALDKVLICKIDCLQVLTPSIKASEGGDEHFVDYQKVLAKREAEVINRQSQQRYPGDFENDYPGTVSARQRGELS